MFADNNTTKTQISHPINMNDLVIRFIMDNHLRVGVIHTSAFQSAQLKKGLSVSIDRLLDSKTRFLVIKSLEKNNNNYVKDCSAVVKNIKNIIDDSGNEIFDIIYSPIQENIQQQIPENPAHADIIFSEIAQKAVGSVHKSYQSKLMKCFNI